MFELPVEILRRAWREGGRDVQSSACPNNLYNGAQPALVPCYPRIGDDVLNKYERTELELFL
jgi:hypothetical protein